MNSNYINEQFRGSRSSHLNRSHSSGGFHNNSNLVSSRFGGFYNNGRNNLYKNNRITYGQRRYNNYNHPNRYYGFNNWYPYWWYNSYSPYLYPYNNESNKVNILDETKEFSELENTNIVIN